MITAVVLATLAVIAALTGACFYVAGGWKSAQNLAAGANSAWRVEVLAKAEVTRQMESWKAQANHLSDELTAKEDQVSRLRSLQLSLEAKCNELIDKLADAGDPRALATAVRDELRALSHLSAGAPTKDR